jgi:hypothetical protein
MVYDLVLALWVVPQPDLSSALQVTALSVEKAADRRLNVDLVLQ